MYVASITQKSSAANSMVVTSRLQQPENSYTENVQPSESCSPQLVASFIYRLRYNKSTGSVALETKEVLLNLRKKHRLWQTEMVAYLMLNRQAVSRWENGAMAMRNLPIQICPI